MSKLSRLDVMKLFKTKIVEFLDALIEQFPHEGDFIILRVFLAEQIPIQDVVEVFARRIIPFSDIVRKKDEKFFLECEDVFKGLGKDKVSYFKNIWTSGNLDEDDKENIWKWFHLFLSLSENYVNATH
jgi:hypothetical protein